MWFDVAQQGKSPQNNWQQPQTNGSVPSSVSSKFLSPLYAQSYMCMSHPLITPFLFPLLPVALVSILWRPLLTGFCLRFSDIYFWLCPFCTLKHCNSIDWPVFRIQYHWIYFSSNASECLLAFLMSCLERTHFEKEIKWSHSVMSNSLWPHGL